MHKCGVLPITSQEQIVLQALLRSIRKEAGLSQRELAQLLKKPQSYVSKYESGERRLDILELRQICKTLGISLFEFTSRLERMIEDHSNAGK
jgi:transcriptional regulator with XRE-family HTH domain